MLVPTLERTSASFPNNHSVLSEYPREDSEGKTGSLVSSRVNRDWTEIKTPLENKSTARHTTTKSRDFEAFVSAEENKETMPWNMYLVILQMT